MKLNSRAVHNFRDERIPRVDLSHRSQYCCDAPNVLCVAKAPRKVRVAWASHNFLFVLIRRTHGQRVSERMKAIAVELCYRLEFHTPLFRIFIHFTHIVPSFHVAVVRHSHRVRFQSAEVCCNSRIRNAIFVCCGISCMCRCVVYNGRMFFSSFHFDLALFLFRSVRLGRACIVCVRTCLSACTAKPLTRMVRWRYRLI